MKRNNDKRQRRKRVIAGIVAGILVALMALGALAPLMRASGANAGAAALYTDINYRR